MQLFIIPHQYVLFNTRFLLAIWNHVTCDYFYFWQYDLRWSHYWSCDRYDLATLTPSKHNMAAFIAWISKSTLFCLFVEFYIESKSCTKRKKNHPHKQQPTNNSNNKNIWLSKKICITTRNHNLLASRIMDLDSIQVLSK